MANMLIKKGLEFKGIFFPQKTDKPTGHMADRRHRRSYPALSYEI